MKRLVIALIVIFGCGLASASAAAQGDEIQKMVEDIKSCQDEACRERLQDEADAVFDRVGEEFNDDFSAMRKDVRVNHIRSLVKETFYHMDRLKDYANYEKVFYLEKLKKLKKQRARFDSGEIDGADFERANRGAQNAYEDDVESSREFVDEKVERLKELCRSINDHAEVLQDDVRHGDRALASSLGITVLSLEREPVWRDFIDNTEKGKNIVKAIESASDGAGNDLVPCLRGLFAGFQTRTTKAVFPEDLIRKLTKKHPIL